MAAKTVTATIYSFERLSSSVNGNPRFKVHTSEGVFVTSSDVSFAYGVEHGLARRPHREATMTLTRAGRVREWEWAQ